MRIYIKKEEVASLRKQALFIIIITTIKYKPKFIWTHLVLLPSFLSSLPQFR